MDNANPCDLKQPQLKSTTLIECGNIQFNCLEPEQDTRVRINYMYIHMAYAN